MRPAEIAIETNTILYGDNFKHKGKTYRAELKEPNEDSLFRAKVVENGKKMTGDWVTFKKKKEEMNKKETK